MSKVFVIDNGSRRTTSQIQLRHIALNLGKKLKITVDPVSVSFADKINPLEIDNQPASVLVDYLKKHLLAGEKNFVGVPLFFGKSRALTSSIPNQMAQLQQEFGYFKLSLAEVIFPLAEGEIRLAEILNENILALHGKKSLEAQEIVVVDHGTTDFRVTKVRERVVEDLKKLLPKDITVDQAVMERREGSQFDFNGPKLEDYLLEKAKVGTDNIIVSLLFFLPGRHAGPGGDIEQIVCRVLRNYPNFKVQVTPLVGDHPKLIDILADRYSAKSI